MTASYTNRANLPLLAAVWLANDNYDHDDRPNHISATSILKPLRQIILPLRVAKEDTIPDVANLAASRWGSAIHDSIENAWLNNHEACLRALGYPEKIIERVKVNPDPATVGPDDFPVYLEQRVEKEVDGFIVSGKYDAIAEGRVFDHKTTGTYTYIHGKNDDKYALQGSIYRWLNPELITDDRMSIIFYFKDWSASGLRDKKYPPTAILEKTYDLIPVQQIDNMVKTKIADIKKYLHAPEDQIPHCSDEDLWREPTIWKVYKTPESKKAMPGGANFDNVYEAQAFAGVKGGIVKEFPGGVKACRYCDAYTVCTQKDLYLQTGELVIGG